jgi:hypothetical protein
MYLYSIYRLDGYALIVDEGLLLLYNVNVNDFFIMGIFNVIFE